MEILNRSFAGNTLKVWAIAVAIALVSFLVLSVLKKIVSRRFSSLARRTANHFDDFIAEVISRTRPFFLLMISIYIGSRILSLTTTWRSVVNKLAIAAILIQAGVWGNGLYEAWRERLKREEKAQDPASLSTIKALGFLGRLALWVIILLLLLENLGINITALVAGLGIGGIAFALAMQSILGDLLASMSILLDKPFVIGDFIAVDNLSGTVEHIGLKTTRICSLTGEQLIFSNNDLLKSRIKNIERMENRRVIFTFQVDYATPPEKLEAIPGMIQAIVEGRPPARFDRCHLKEFGAYAYVVEASYFIASKDYKTYLDVQHDIILAISRRFQETNIRLAIPIQSVVVTSPPGTPHAAR
jgi:small-conductance mechanosensitive channel